MILRPDSQAVGIDDQSAIVRTDDALHVILPVARSTATSIAIATYFSACL